MSIVCLFCISFSKKEILCEALLLYILVSKLTSHAGEKRGGADNENIPMVPICFERNNRKGVLVSTLFDQSFEFFFPYLGIHVK